MIGTRRHCLPLLLTLLAACSAPAPPASDDAPSAAADATELDQAIQEPLDRARGVEARMKAAEAAENDQIDEQSR